MKKPSTAGCTPAPAAGARRTLLQVLRDPQLYPIVRALLSDQITRMDFAGALPYWTFPEQGDEILVPKEQLDDVLRALAASTGRPLLKAKEVRDRRTGAILTLQISAAAKTDVLMEMLALGAHLSADDLEILPPPLDVQSNSSTNSADRARKSAS